MMFEDSLVEVQISQQTVAKRWTMLGSVALQAAIAATLVVLPLLHPERLSFHADTPLVFTPPPPRPPVHVEQVQPMTISTADTSLIQPPAMPNHTLIPRDPVILTDAPPSTGPIRMGASDTTGILNNLLSSGSGSGSTVVSVARPETPKRIPVSSGVSAGLLLSPIRPVYPAIARAAGISGSVVVEAVISKTGSLESLRVLSGPEMLRAAALDAIRTARYRPYLLNGEPTEVQTTFTVNFRLGS